jgi:hypothetical protein
MLKYAGAEGLDSNKLLNIEVGNSTTENLIVASFER